MIGPALYAPIDRPQRLAPGWASMLLGVGIAVAGLILTAVAFGVMVGIDIASGAADLDNIEAYIQSKSLELVVIQFLTLYPALALIAVFWTKVVERRSLASIGLKRPRALARYARGAAGGVGLAVALFGLGGVAALAFGVDQEQFGDVDLALLARPDYVRVMLAAMVLVLVQSACEELTYRGWLLSSATAKSGLLWGVIFSSAAFGLIHADRAFIDPAVGAGVVLGTATVGVAFAFWARNEGAVVGVMGAHGGYNVTLIVGSLAALFATSDGAGVRDIITEMQVGMVEELKSPAALASIAAQIALFGGFAWVLARFGRAKPPPAPEPDVVA